MLGDVKLCQAKGFVCEFCGNDKDIIFPYELNKCQRCEECNACYHKTCFKSDRECPRCQRLAERRERMARKNMEEDEDNGGATSVIHPDAPHGDDDQSVAGDDQQVDSEEQEVQDVAHMTPLVLELLLMLKDVQNV
ncbi:hypothetical protein NFI96_000327 [Prochilodus magdalenae]|nr:hypothetical protein NFI96_000327 [Prochilodus magdalenae]